MLSAVDSNIPIYAFLDARDQRKSAVALDLLADLVRDERCVLSVQVLNEFCNVAMRRTQPPLSEADLTARIEQLKRFRVAPMDEDLTIRAIQMHFASRISFYDALIVEAALINGAEVLYSEDLQHGQVFGPLRIVNPFL